MYKFFVKRNNTAKEIWMPYMEDIVKTLDYANATEKAPSILAHNMELRMKLPKQIRIYLVE